MEKEYYYVYCKGILGVKTNFRDFKWVYGSNAPCTSSEEYENCVVKFDICFKPEKRFNKPCACDRRFQAYFWDSKTRTICYDRRFLKKVGISYQLHFGEGVVNAKIGSNYFKFVKNRIMNMHGVYYLLSDLANVLLLKNGFLTLYSSAVYMESFKRCVINFAPPNTGKTCMAMFLCNRYGGTLLGEDVVIYDGEKVHPCPWTSSYRKSRNSILDSSGALGRGRRADVNIASEACRVTDLAALSLGERKIDLDKSSTLKDVILLNGYLFNYYSSPIVKVLSYFDDEFDRPWSVVALDYLKAMVDDCNCYRIQSEESVDFAEIFYKIISDNKV